MVPDVTSACVILAASFLPWLSNHQRYSTHIAKSTTIAISEVYRTIVAALTSRDPYFDAQSSWLSVPVLAKLLALQSTPIYSQLGVECGMLIRQSDFTYEYKWRNLRSIECPCACISDMQRVGAESAMGVELSAARSRGQSGVYIVLHGCSGQYCKGVSLETGCFSEMYFVVTKVCS
jgi:hypothetical protein